MCGRDAQRVNDAAARIRQQLPESHIETGVCDLASMPSLKAFAADFLSKHQTLDALVANAGVMMPPLTFVNFTGTDGPMYELQMATNVLGHHALTKMLLPALTATEGARVIAVSSMASEHGTLDLSDMQWEKRSYDRFRSYAETKLGNILFASELARRYPNILAVSLHPGVIRTELTRYLPSWMQLPMQLMTPLLHVVLKSPEEGAQTQLFATLAPRSELVNGGYYSDCAYKVNRNPQAHDAALAAQLWETCERIIAA